MTCPIVRDTASVPCWLAEYDGELYFLTLQTDVSAARHSAVARSSRARRGHGREATRPRICGGVVLEPVVLSVLPELDAACNTTVLPAEERYNLTFEPPRPPGPSGGRLAFDRRRAAPARGARRAGPREFTLRYDFDTAVMGRHSGVLTQIFDYARKIKARRIEITGHRGASLLSDGTTLTERAELAEIRAREVAKLLAGAGIDAAAFEVEWSSELERARRRRRLARAPHERYASEP